MKSKENLYNKNDPLHIDCNVDNLEQIQKNSIKIYCM